VELTQEMTIALRAAQEAGEVAMGMQGGVSRRDKADGSPVSDADIAADAVVTQQLNAFFPHDAILSEERVDEASRLQARRLWIIDPIDGTRDYLAGEPGWAVQVALAIDGALALGVVAMPRFGICLAGLPGVGGTMLTAAGAAPLAVAPGGDDVLIGSGSKRNREAMARVRAALPEFANLTSTSVGVKALRLLEGAADLYVHPRAISEWDVAAPAAVLIAAGGHATDLAGRAFRFNTPSASCPGLVFSTRDDHQALIARLASAGVEAAS
jgi:myo-inositol-1(or 4)-monophosphatase